MQKITPSIRVPLIMLQICGFNPLKNGLISNILQAITVLASFILVLSMTLEIPLNWNGLETLAKLNLFSLATAILVKSYNLKKHHALLEEMLNSIDDLYPLNKYGSEINQQLLKYDNYVLLFIKVFIGASFISSTQFFAAPLFTNVYQVPFGGYELCDIISSSECYWAHFVWQFLAMNIHVIPITVGYDGIFASLIGRGFSAIRLLKYGFRNLNITAENDDDRLMEELNDLVDQHNVILLYIKRFKGFLSGVLLAQFCFSLGGTILSMYMVLSQGSSIAPADLLRFGFAYCLFAFELFLFCLGGTILIDELDTISSEIFALEWHLQTKIRKRFAYIIARCNYGDNLKAGKIIDLNLMSFVNVLRTSVSICTLLVTVGQSMN